MAIEIGDAVMHFWANTQDLDAAFDRVGAEAGTKLTPAVAAVDNLGKQFVVAGAGAKELGAVTNLAGEEVKFSMYEARGEVALLGEELGIKVPRHLRSFLVELPGVGEAMTAAFSATAVLFLVQILFEGAKKLTEFIEATLIFTDAAKKSNTEIAETNKGLEKNQERLTALKKIYEEMGETTLQKLSGKLRDANSALADQKKALQEAIDKWQELTHNHDAEIEKIRLSEGFWKSSADSVLSFLHIRTFAEKTLQEETSLSEKKVIESSSNVKVAEQAVANDRKAHGIEFTKVIEKSIGDWEKYMAELRKELETTETDFKSLSEHGTNFAQIAKDGPAQITPVMNDFAKTVLEAANAMRYLGVTSAGQMNEGLLEDKRAVEDIERAVRSHAATLGDLHRAKLRQVQDEILVQRALGHSTFELQQQEKEIRKTIPGLKDLSEGHKLVELSSHAMGSAFTAAAFAFGQGAETIGQALQKILAATIQAIGQEADIQGAKELAKGFAALAPTSPDFGFAGTHFLSAAEWFALGGATSIAAGAVAGGGSSSSGGGGSSGRGGSPINTSPAAATQATVATSVNVQRFAAGGLVTGPTLALIGETENGGSQTEAVVPLDGPEGRKFGGDTIINIYNKGNVIDHKGLMKQISRQTKNNQGRLQSTDSYRNTRKG